MTLCVAWKFGNTFCLGADSRITGGDSTTDLGIKVLECPIRVISAVDSATRHYDLLHHSSVGIAFSGSFLTAYLVKERIAEVLLNLQFLGSKPLLTFRKIAEAAFKVYCHAVAALNAAYSFGHDTDMFLVGICPSNGTPTAFKFWRDENTEELGMVEILTGTGFDYDAIGAGEDRIRERIEARLNGKCMFHSMVLEEIREIIINNEVASVGGAIQYGHTEGNQPFEIFGVIDFRMRDGLLEPLRATRGIELGSLVSNQINGLVIRESLIAPFQRLLERSVS